MNKRNNRIPLIKEEKSKEFIKRYNENKVSDEFLASCKVAGKLFKRKKK